MDYLDELENKSIYIFREAFRKFRNLAMLWSIGKDSTVLLHLARKAFFGRVPFPLAHIDTTFKYPEMIEFRDKIVKDWNLDLVVGGNQKALDEGMNYTRGRLVCCEALKTNGLSKLMEQYKFTGLFLGIRRDEEGTRAKERVFSPRDKNFEWKYKDQPPEIWDQFNTDFDEGTHIRIHPILHWTELNVWEYIKREEIPLCSLYFAKDGKRFRSLGCMPCTTPIESDASNIDEIIVELENTTVPERAGRKQDQEADYAMQRLRKRGYM